MPPEKTPISEEAFPFVTATGKDVKDWIIGNGITLTLVDAEAVTPALLTTNVYVRVEGALTATGTLTLTGLDAQEPTPAMEAVAPVPKKVKFKTALVP